MGSSTQRGSVTFNVGAAEFIPSSEGENKSTDAGGETTTLSTGPRCGEAVVLVPTLSAATPSG